MLKPEDILKTEYSPEYDKLRQNRILVSFHKYGPIRENFGNKLVDAVGSLERCIAKYKETGNTEYLVDAGNYCMFEFMYPQISGAYFKATESKESAGIVGMSINEIKNYQADP